MDGVDVPVYGAAQLLFAATHRRVSLILHRTHRSASIGETGHGFGVDVLATVGLAELTAPGGTVAETRRL